MSASSEAHNEKAAPSRRKIPLPSEMIIMFMNVIYTVVYLILKPMGLAPAAMAFLSGGLFGLLLLPVSVTWGLLTILRHFHGPLHDVILHLLYAFCAWYFWTLLTDQTHRRTADTCFRTPRNVFDRIAYQFFMEIFDYFPMTCEPVSPKVATLLARSRQQYVVGVHPHGIHCFPLAHLSSPGTPFDDQFPGLVSGSSSTNNKSSKTPLPSFAPLTGLAATVVFKIPVVREFFLTFGYIDASRPVASKALEEGKSIFVCTGGEEESMYCNAPKTNQEESASEEEDVLILQNRKGFVRLALTHGADLLPMYGIGNNDVFTTYSWGIRIRRWIQKNLKIALPIFHGVWGTPLPYRKPIRVIVGEPIATPANPQQTKPDEQVVAEYHDKYMQAVKEMHAQFSQRPLRIA